MVHLACRNRPLHRKGTPQGGRPRMLSVKHQQLLFDFGRSVMRHLRLLPDAPAPAAAHRAGQRGIRRDPALETLCRRLLRAAGCRTLNVRVHWNHRLRTTAGLACWTKKTISLNPRLCAISPGEVQKTLRHELAHFLAQHRAGGRRITPHGPEWKEACRALGIPREPRCHNLPFKRTRIAPKFFYACRHCGKTIARVRRPSRPIACITCCKKFNRGKYHDNFRFLPTQPPNRAAA
jgi:SprT protein